jgi:DNA-binding CsgD family transcriptional regulator
MTDQTDSDSNAPRVEIVEIDGVEVIVLSVPLDPDLPDTLTTSEREAVLLALRGATNAEIAQARGTALQTAANQLRSAFQKMGVQSREELAVAVFGRTWVRLVAVGSSSFARSSPRPKHRFDTKRDPLVFKAPTGRPEHQNSTSDRVTIV